MIESDSGIVKTLFNAANMYEPVHSTYEDREANDVRTRVFMPSYYD